MKTKLAGVLLCVAFASACASSESAAPAAESDPAVAEQSTNTDITVTPGLVQGSGCKPDTFRTKVSSLPDGRRIFSVETAAFRLSSEGKPAIQSTYCDIEFNVAAKNNKRFALSRVQFKGLVHLEETAKAQVDLTYGFKDAAIIPTRSHKLDFQGPKGFNEDSEWNFPDDSFDPLVYSPCNAKRIVELHTILRLSDLTQEPGSFLSMEQASGVLTQDPPPSPETAGAIIVELEEQTCP